MKQIQIKGEILSDNLANVYKGYGYSCTCPSDILNDLDGSDDVELVINSPGGSVFDAAEIYTAIKEYDGKVTAKIVGLAASAASWIAMAADEVSISPLGLMMVHNAQSFAIGDHREMDASSNMLKSVDDAIRSAYKLKAGLSDDELETLMNAETWFNANEAKETGLVDSVLFMEDVNPDVVLNGLRPDREVLQKLIKDSKPTIENLEKEQPELYAEIKNLGVAEERNRIKEIEELSDAGLPDLVNKAKFESPIDARDLAVEILKNQKKLGEAYIDNLTDDKDDVPEIDVTDILDQKQDLIDRIAKGGTK